MTSGLAATLTELEWRKDAAKMVVLIADAPPHGELPVPLDVERKLKQIRDWGGWGSNQSRRSNRT